MLYFSVIRCSKKLLYILTLYAFFFHRSTRKSGYSTLPYDCSVFIMSNDKFLLKKNIPDENNSFFFHIVILLNISENSHLST